PFPSPPLFRSAQRPRRPPRRGRSRALCNRPAPSPCLTPDTPDPWGDHTVKRTTAAVLLALATLTACSSGDSSTDSKPDKPAAVPAYKITQQDDSGTQRVVAVDVDSTKDMK